MENPFTKYQKYVDKPGRSAKDLSYDINGTYGIGTLYPAGIWEVNAGESFKIKSAFGLKFLPMPYPIQTRLRANLYYYYVRNRNTYDGWKDFIYQNKSNTEVPHPHIKRPASDREFWKTGGIMDHLGCPTTLVQKGRSGTVNVSVDGLSSLSSRMSSQYSSSSSSIPSSQGFAPGSIFLSPTVVGTSYRYFAQYSRPYYLWTSFFESSLGDPGDFAVANKTWSQCLVDQNYLNVPGNGEDFLGYRAHGYRTGVFYQPPLRTTNSGVDDSALLSFLNCVPPGDLNPRHVTVMVFAGSPDDVRSHPTNTRVATPLDNFKCVYSTTPGEACLGTWISGSTTFQVLLSSKIVKICEELVAAGNCYYFFVGENNFEASKMDNPLVSSGLMPLFNSSANLGNLAQLTVYASSVVDIADYPEMNLFASQAGADPVLPLSALPLRAYESVYNAWFRPERLDPLMINGQPEYNKFCPNTSDGWDEYPYTLHKRNWESDFLTTALPTPQQGVAPVVGVTGLSDIQLDDDGTIRTFKAEVAEDGETIVGGSFNEPGASMGAKRTIQQMITAGFTINDLRNVSALQRWVENNIRRGLKYRDQVLANTGVKVGYDELDMPEFLGGFSRPVNVAAITQTAPGGEAGVGDYAGQANAFGEGKHSISHYCDEAGFIIAVLCIVPEPVYSQLLPKYFLKDSPLDYFHPAFNHIGMQPITYREVCPIQVFANNPEQSSDKIRLNDVFGYQRPWYDLMARVNEVHGLMRTEMRDYVMNRTFDEVPELGPEFVHIDPEQVNDVFSVTLPDHDVCMGQIIHQCYCKSQISLFGQPKIQ